MRIVSFLPSATEMVCALGLSEELVGITHECDYPPEVQGKPIVVTSVLPLETMTQREIDEAVTARLRNGQSLYQVDERLLNDLQPDIIITQDLCQVCAPSGNELSQALKVLSRKPEILWMTPKSISGIEDNIRALGKATGLDRRAGELIAGGRARLESIAAQTRTMPVRPRVFCMEWLDPIYCSGHWVPELVRIAGGLDALGREGSDSVRIRWDDVRKWDPEFLIVIPCGFHIDKVVEQTPKLCEYDGWAGLAAVRKSQVYAVDANSYFARPGPRIIDGAELLAHVFYPDRFSWNGPSTAYRRVELTEFSRTGRS
jgi:iron complex transport system substrate-binding protein